MTKGPPGIFSKNLWKRWHIKPQNRTPLKHVWTPFSTPTQGFWQATHPLPGFSMKWLYPKTAKKIKYTTTQKFQKLNF
jgi:hypothetical protein